METRIDKSVYKTALILFSLFDHQVRIITK